MNIHRRSYTEAKGGRTFYKLHDLSQCCLNCTNFGKLSLRKIIKIAATRCHTLKLKCTKLDFGCGSAPDPAGGAYSRAAVGMGIPMGIPMGMVWVWGL